MMKRSAVFHVLLSALLTFGCSGEQYEEESGETIHALPVERRVELPGVLIAPTGDSVSVGPDTAVILYYWLPIDLYDEMEQDLLFLASLDSTVLPLPVQPDRETRNHAQRVVNDLGISLPVYLADTAVMNSMDCTILPFSMLLRPGEDPLTENGFGSPARLLAPRIREE